MTLIFARNVRTGLFLYFCARAWACVLNLTGSFKNSELQGLRLRLDTRGTGDIAYLPVGDMQDDGLRTPQTRLAPDPELFPPLILSAAQPWTSTQCLHDHRCHNRRRSPAFQYATGTPATQGLVYGRPGPLTARSPAHGTPGRVTIPMNYEAQARARTPLKSFQSRAPSPSPGPVVGGGLIGIAKHAIGRRPVPLPGPPPQARGATPSGEEPGSQLAAACRSERPLISIETLNSPCGATRQVSGRRVRGSYRAPPPDSD
jgi:hypothetical protein